MKFSVIIPLHNKAGYIEKALRSVAAQTFKDYELIVVDDGSEDDSAAVAEMCLNEFWSELNSPQVKLLRQTNTGVSTARNNGMAASSGEFICFLDADDWWSPFFLEEMMRLIGKYPEAGIYGCSYFIVKNGDERRAPVGVEDAFIDGHINYCRVYARTLCMPLTSITVAIPRHVFLHSGGFKPALKFGEDFDLWIRISLKHNVVFLNKPLAFYNQDVDAATRGVGRLHSPESHMLWNLDYLCAEENKNNDYKILIDRLRAYGLMPYYLSRRFNKEAQDQLAKIDWSNVDRKWERQYHHIPVRLLRMTYSIRKLGSTIKTKLG